MSLSDLRPLAFLVLLVLPACGFEPALAPGTGGEALRGSIEIADPADVEGFALVRQLENRLGRTTGGDYRLEADIRLAEDGVGIQPDQTTTRFQVAGTVTYRLTDARSDEELHAGRVSNFTSYSATSTSFATTAAQRDARERLMVTLADQIVEELTLTREVWAR